MYVGKLVFAQIINHLPLHTFRRCVARYRGQRKLKSFSCLDQYLCMAFAQLTYRESLRDIETCLRAQRNKLYHMGIRGQVSRNTLANANRVRDWRIYADFAQSLIHVARRLYAGEDFGVELDETVYALDATLIDLSLTLFPWAPHARSRAGVKLHTLLDLRGPIPSLPGRGISRKRSRYQSSAIARPAHSSIWASMIFSTRSWPLRYRCA